MNLMIVRSCEKLKTVLDNKYPPATEAEARKRWKESNEIARCYKLERVTRTLYKKLESYPRIKTTLQWYRDIHFGYHDILPLRSPPSSKLVKVLRYPLPWYRDTNIVRGK
ncbi:hypothetical protein PVK06_047038 [Gossypium arboreum]|uniref:Uncharacterized protein n=1 Tax=Gossypium arboreum TaxID=29729 RepID=A0ABR0MCA6_GOSAR|nr:hypothetical protein PVK06_047038 [Gossypium arboreum]